MALIPNINICLQSGCTALVFKETTGIYNASTNIGGYGAPNATTVSVTSAQLLITAPDSTSYIIDLKSTTLFPSTNDELEYTIPLSSIGNNRLSIEDGYWQFAYYIGTGGGSTVYSVTKSYFFYCNAECCVSKLLSSIDIDKLSNTNDLVNNKKIENYTRVRTLLSTLKSAANCGNETQFNKIKSLISKYCRNTDCITCN